MRTTQASRSRAPQRNQQRLALDNVHFSGWSLLTRHIATTGRPSSPVVLSEHVQL